MARNKKLVMIVMETDMPEHQIEEFWQDLIETDIQLHLRTRESGQSEEVRLLGMEDYDDTAETD